MICVGGVNMRESRRDTQTWRNAHRDRPWPSDAQGRDGAGLPAAPFAPLLPPGRQGPQADAGQPVAPARRGDRGAAPGAWRQDRGGRRRRAPGGALGRSRARGRGAHHRPPAGLAGPARASVPGAGPGLRAAGVAGGPPALEAVHDRLVGRQDHIEAELARRHLQAGGIAMFDLSSSWMEGSHCELACFGHSRDGKRGQPQIEYGLLCDPAGRPVAVRVVAGNTADPTAFTQAVEVVRGSFDLRRLILVGDRGMITSARIADLRAIPGMAWITALRAPAIKQLAQDDGPLQLGLFDQTDLAEITSPDYPGEWLVACRNPLLAQERARKRADLLAATQALLAKVKQQVDAGRLKDPDKIRVKADRALRKHKVGKHLVVQIAQGSISWHRDQAKVNAEAALDGIYVIRTSVPAKTLDAPATVAAYKNLAFVERDFRHIKADDLDLRPIWHRLADRVRGHVLVCMLACYLAWHLRKAWAQLTFTDEQPPVRADPVAPARRSPTAQAKAARKTDASGQRMRSFRDLLDHLSTLTRNTITIGDQTVDKLTNPTPTQRRAFQLLQTPIPLTLA